MSVKESAGVILKLLHQVLHLLRNSNPRLSFAVALFSVLEAFFGLAVLYMIKVLIDVLSKQLENDAAAVDLIKIFLFLSLTGIGLIGAVGLQVLGNWARLAQGMIVAEYVDREIHSQATTIDLAFFESPQYFDSLQRARQAGSQRPAKVVSGMLLIFRSLVVLIAVLVMISGIEWYLLPAIILATIAGLTHSAVVYHCVDDLSAIPGIDPVAFNAEEQRLLGRCQAVFVTSESLKEKCLPFNANTHYFPNVVDVDHFGQAHEVGPLPDDLASIPSPRIGYIGALSDFKVDFELIHDVAKARQDWSWVLIGDEREGQHSVGVAKLRNLPNVYFLGHKPYEQLPHYLRGIDVGTLPTLLNEYTRSMFPMKYFEYIAAGIRVVSTPLEFTKQEAGGIEIGTDQWSFVESINQQLNYEKLTKEEGRILVGDNTWASRLSKTVLILSERK